MKSEIITAFSEIVREKNIDKDVLSDIIENIFLTIIRKKYGTTENFECFVHLDKGEIEIYQTKTIVDTVNDDVLEIDLESAQKFEPDLELGDEYIEIIDPASFGRRLIISAKQNLNQKLKEIEKETVFEEFQNRIGEIVTGDIRQVSRDEIYINIDRTEVILPLKERIYNERYHRGDTLRAIVKDVQRTTRGPEIIVSRADETFLTRLFELEVPEIYDGIIEIKAIAREPGDRTKIAVYSNEKRIDAVGACVGMKGIRIQSIVKELNNEKIDIINWSNEPEIFVSRALSPAKPSRIILDEDNKKVIAMLPDDQISLAIGKGGQNRRLASKLTGFEIQTVKESDFRDILRAEEQKDMDIEEVEGLTPSLLKKLIEAGIETVHDVMEADLEGLIEIPGIGQKTAEKILDLVSEEYEE